MDMKMGRVSRSVGAAVVGLLMLSGAAYAEGSATLLVPADIQNSATIDTINALMEPIAPFTQGREKTTTAVVQNGADNYATAAIVGNSNLTVISQDGTRNRAVQAISGEGSALLLAQGGSNNDVVQAAFGDRDFQLVGVSGNNNQVGYVQVGNDLAGVLDVRNSVNSTVLVLQTPASGRYLMPTGLSGLHNATVVIGPGRMYVLPKK